MISDGALEVGTEVELPFISRVFLKLSIHFLTSIYLQGHLYRRVALTIVCRILQYFFRILPRPQIFFLFVIPPDLNDCTHLVAAYVTSMGNKKKREI